MKKKNRGKDNKRKSIPFWVHWLNYQDSTKKGEDKNKNLKARKNNIWIHLKQKNN